MRTVAMQWWNSIDNQFELTQMYFRGRNSESLTGREIEMMWRGEQNRAKAEGKILKPADVVMLPVIGGMEVDMVFGLNKGNYAMGEYTKTLWYKEPSPLSYKYTEQYLYFVNDEEIKEDDFVINLYSETIFQVVTVLLDGWECKKLDDKYAVYRITKDSGATLKKVIATTNPDLWHGDRVVDGKVVSEYLAVAKIPTSFIEAYVREQGIDKVMLEYELYQEESKWNKAGDRVLQHGEIKNRLKLKDNGSVIVHPAPDTWEDVELFVNMRAELIDPDLMRIFKTYFHPPKRL